MYARRGMPITYPRTIYTVTSKSDMDGSLCEDRKYKSHRNITIPDGVLILRKNHDHTIFWGYRKLEFALLNY